MSKYSKHSKIREFSKKKVVVLILMIIFLLSILMLINIKYKEYEDNNKQKEISQVLDKIVINESDVTKNTTERMLKLIKLQKDNPEVIGWIKIDGTNINYPVCQTSNNDYYLNNTYDNEKNSNGSIFLDKDYDFSIPSENLLIYGHRNKTGLMFDDLEKYKSEEFYKEHSTIIFTTNKEDAIYEIISVFNSRVYYQDEKDVFRYYNFVNAKTELDFKEYIKNIEKYSIYNTGKIATTRRSTYDIINM